MSGIPVLIKDNINTKNTPTSAGTYALKDFTPAENAPMVEALLQNGAIILGKANLSEMANFMDTKMPSGYSSKAGQTHNPFNPITLSPQGSSSGSGAGVAANLSAVAIGTETTGSIIAPAAIHSVVGYKPTKNMIATDGVVPLSSTMDTVGTLTKTVEDTVLLFNASVSDASKKVLQPTDPSYLAGKKIGVGGQNTDLLVQKLKDAGAEVVTVTLDEKDIDNGVIINQDFKHDLNQYLTRYNAPVKSLSELITFNKEDKNRRAKYGQRLIEEAESNKDTDRAKVDRMVQEAQKRINTLMTEQQLDAIAFVDNEGVVLPAVAGYPVITVPLGATEDGTPLGATFTAKAQEDAKLLQIAYSFEQKTGGRLIPEKYKNQF